MKAALETEHNSHEREMAPTTNSIMTETSRLLIANKFHKNILITKHIKKNILQWFGDC